MGRKIRIRHREAGEGVRMNKLNRMGLGSMIAGHALVSLPENVMATIFVGIGLIIFGLFLLESE